MSENPYFSVVIPAYNAEQYIEFALNSVYQQTYTDYEIVVVNDGSTDNTQEILAAQKDLRLRVITQKNGGECEARNRGIKEARGQFLAFLDADDAWAPNHLSIARQFFLNHPEYVWYYTNPARFVDDSELMQQASDDKPGCYMVQNWFAEVAELPLSSSCVLKKSALPMLDIFPVGVKMYGDNCGWCEIALKYPMIGTCENTTAYYRIHGESISSVYSVAYRVKERMAAVRVHRQQLTTSDCSHEARLFYSLFAANQWRLNIRNVNMLGYLSEITATSGVNGRMLTMWLLVGAWLSRILELSVASMLMLKIKCLDRRLRLIARKQRCILGND